MPHNNPVRDGIESGDGIQYIDHSCGLSELPTHLTQQDIETLVGLNINTSDLEALQLSTDSHCVDSSGVLLSNQVGNIVEVENETVAMDISESISQESHSMDMMDSLTDHTQSLNDLDILHHGHEFIPITGTEELMESTQCDDELSHKAFLSSSSQEMELPSLDQNTQHIVGGESLATQILKTSSGQFVILQPNQHNSIPLSGSTMKTNLTSSSSPMFSSISNTNISKPIFINTNQLNTGVKQMTVRSNQPQFRTLQLKTPISLSQMQLTNTTRPVTKVILSTQPGGGNLTQQLRLITSNNNNSNVNQTMTYTTNKIAVQLPPAGQPKNIMPSPVKTIASRENFNQISSPQKIVITNKIKQPITSVNSSNIKPSQLITGSNTQLIKIPINQLSQLSTNQSINLSSFSNNKLSGNFRIVSTLGMQNKTTPITNSMTMAPSHKLSVNINKPVVIPNNKTTRTITLPPSSQPITISQQDKQRVFLTSQSNNLNSSTIQIRPPNRTGSITLPPGVLSNAQPGSLVMIPAQYFQNSASSNNVVQLSNQPQPVTPAPPKPIPPKTLIDANGIKPRKPCNCTKSQCLKLYCDCFANGEFCNNCNCNNCFNNLSHEEDRQKAIKSCLERNPLAFRPKIGKGGHDAERRHNKGCNCKRSGCLKNYCECFEAKIPCSNMCKCVGCRNIDSGMPYERKRLISDTYDTKPLAIRARPISMASLPSPAKMNLSTTSKSIYCRINQEVVSATCNCLLAQGEKAEKNNTSQAQIELDVINEFSRCLLQIIGVHTKIKGPID